MGQDIVVKLKANKAPTNLVSSRSIFLCVKKRFNQPDKMLVLRRPLCPRYKIWVKVSPIICINVRVSVQGVEPLWGDCRFIPADWGS